MAGILLTRVREHLDALIALVLAIIFSILGFVEVTSSEAIDNAILVTLTVLAFALLRDHWGRERFEDLPILRELTAELRGFNEHNKGVAELRILAGASIGEAFEEARRNCRRWVYKGGAGTYLRAVTLPALAQESHRHGRRVEIQIQIIDPANEALCESYARHHFTEDPWPENGGPWTCEQARLAALATVVAACWYMQRYALLRIELALLPTWSTFRYDQSPSCLLITERGKDRPAFLAPAGSVFYERIDTDLEVSFVQGRRLPLYDAPPLDASPTPEQLRKLFAAMGLPVGPGYDLSTMTAIISKALMPSNPYDSANKITPVTAA
jgi:hypothetical protein